VIKEKEKEEIMPIVTRDGLWEMTKREINENPRGFAMEKIADKIHVKPGFVKDNPRLIIVDYITILVSAGFLKVKHKSVSEKFFRIIYVPIWKIPKNITITEVDNLSKQPSWVLWFIYPEGNLM
jgi:hypothetical protein